MEFLAFPYSKEIKESYIPQNLVLEYLNSYADVYNLRKYIKVQDLTSLPKLYPQLILFQFCHYVKLVEPEQPPGWSLTILDAKTKVTALQRFDAVIICIGHYSTPRLPKIKGQEIFKGYCIHSHDYRIKSPYKNKKVMVLGGGSSGIDIAIIIASVAETVK